MEGKESPVDLALHVGEVRGRQAAADQKLQEIETWRKSADERLSEQRRQLDELPDKVAAAINEEPIEAPRSDPSDTKISTASSSTADPNAPTNLEPKADGSVQPPPAVPNPADQARTPGQATSSDGSPPIASPPPAPTKRRSLADRFR